MSINEGGWQLTAFKKMAKATQKALKVIIESWTSQDLRFDNLTLESEVRYG